MNRRRALSLMELLISCALFSLLVALLTLAWIRGSRAWLSASAVTQRLSQMQALRHRIERELQESTAASLDTQSNPGILSFASPRGLRTNSQGDLYTRIAGTALPQWQRYSLYWWNPDTQSLYGREIPLPAGHPNRQIALPLPQVSNLFTASPQPLATYANPTADPPNTRLLADHVSLFQVIQEHYAVQFVAHVTDAGLNHPDRVFTLQSVSALRN